MKYDFDQMPDRSGTDCIKWDYLRKYFGQDGLNALWVADMDFKAPAEILNPIIKRAEHGIFGYTEIPEGFYSAVIGWFKNRYGWQICRDWIVVTPGVVPALNLAIQTFTEPGAGVIIQPPVYFPFRDSVELNGRKLLNNPLKLLGGKYTMDLDDLNEKAAEAEILVLCSPHNPVSRVWTEKELAEIGVICERNGLLVFSDEIHADIVFSPAVHKPLAPLSEYLTRRSISAYATSKTFNLAGLQLSVNIVPDSGIRETFILSLERLHLNMSNIFGIVGTQAAYTHGAEWLDQLIEYLRLNYVTVKDYLEKEIPGISVMNPEGTYLLWLDCRRLNLSDDQLASLFVNRAGLALSPGEMFGPGGSGFMRLNIACPRQNLLKALISLKAAMEDHTPIPDKACCSDGKPKT